MKKRSILHKISRRLSGGEQLYRAERILKDLYLQCERDEYCEQISHVRKILRRQRQKQERMISVCGCILCIVLVILLIYAGVCLGKGPREEKPSGSAAGMAQTETEGSTEASVKSTRLAGPAELLFTFTGDFILGTDEYFAWDTGFNAYYDMYGAEYFLENVRDIFQKDDLTVINMEGTLTEEAARMDKQFAFKGEPEFVEILASSSVEAANVANNHSHDYGEKSFQDTVNTLEARNIRTFGYDKTEIITVKGVKTGFLGIYELDDHLERIPQLKSNIAKLKADGADIIVAVFHWGNELETVPDENQVTLAHLAIDEGADLVVGHHPHVVQGIETYKGKTIAYSLGNFCFGGNTHPTEMDTMIFQQHFTVGTSGEITESRYEIIPCSVSSESTFNNYQPSVLTGEEAERVQKIIEERSSAI